MVGRATFGNPWLMGEVCIALGISDKENVTKYPETLDELKKAMLMHCELSLKAHGSRKGMLDVRKHFATYIKGFPNASKYRSELVRVESIEDVQNILNKII